LFPFLRCNSKPWPRRWRRLLTTRQNSGIAALEFGLIAPVFLIALAGTVDMGGELYTRFCLDAAVAAASNYAIVNANDMEATDGTTLAGNIASIASTSNTATAANVTVVVNDGPTVKITSGVSSSSGSAANIASSYYCPTGSGSSLAWGSSYSSNTVACGGGGLAGQFVTITASLRYSPIITGYSFAKSGTMSVSAIVQLQ
jgi:Flp pilus assembly protein TadG